MQTQTDALPLPSGARRGETWLFSFLTAEPWLPVYKVALHALLVSDLLFSSRLNRALVHPGAQQITLSVFIMVVTAAIGVCLVGLYGASTLLCCLAVLIIFLQVAHFSDLSGFPVQITSAFQFLPVATFLFFFLLARVGMTAYMLKWVIRYACLYTFFYLLLAVSFKMGILPYGLVQPILLTDVERGDRIFHYAAMTSISWFYFLHNWRTGRGRADLLGLLMAAAAIAISLSRVYILVVLLLTVPYMLRIDRRLISVASVSLMFSAALVLVFGIADETFNPFYIFSGDSSGNARAIEYEIARYFLRLDPLMGVGLAQSSYELGFLTGNYYFAASDLGILGVWWDFGIVGLLLFVAGSIIVCRFDRSVGNAYAWPLFLTGCSLAAYGCLSPTIFYPGGATVFALLFGLWLDDTVRARAASRR